MVQWYSGTTGYIWLRLVFILLSTATNRMVSIDVMEPDGRYNAKLQTKGSTHKWLFGRFWIELFPLSGAEKGMENRLVKDMVG